MAKLCEQVKLVKSLHNFYGKVGYPKDDPNGEVYKYRASGAAKGVVPEQDFLGYLQVNNLGFCGSIKYFFVKWYQPWKSSFILNRHSKINELYRSCLNDKYIEHFIEHIRVAGGYQDYDQGIRLTTLGTELIDFMGFWEIIFTKYPVTWRAAAKISLALVGILGTLLASGGIIWLLIKAWLSYKFNMNL